MSWYQYITNLMAPTAEGTVVTSEAAICGIEDLCVWAASPGYNFISAHEIRTLAGPRDNFFSCGPQVARIKYVMLVDKMDDETAYSLILKSGECNLCVGKSNKALVLLKGVPCGVDRDLSTKVFGLVTFLRSTGF